MKRPAALGISRFEDIIREKVFYVDKTYFIREWWNHKDQSTLLTRPRRFGKTLTISMIETFFSNRYADRNDLFEGLSIWKDGEFRKLQGTYPVISLSLADVKQSSYEGMVAKLARIVSDLYGDHYYLLESDRLTELDKADFAC